MYLNAVDGEASETLEAALAFIDECGPDLTSASSGNYSDESSLSSYESSSSLFRANPPLEDPVNHGWQDFVLPPSALEHGENDVSVMHTTAESRKENTNRTTKLTKPKRNRSRDRQRVEILQLRAEAEVLQQRVAQMKKHQQEADREDNGNGIIASATQIMQMHHGHRQRDAMRFEVWRDLAERCRRLRRESESDNRNLRHLYKSQVATIETLKKMFRMQERVKTSIRFNARYYVNSSFDADEDALITMKCLQGGLGQLKDETDHVLLSNGLCAITSPFSQTNMNSTSETSTYIEVLNCRVIPFDYKVVGEAFWYEMTKNYVENEAEREQPHEEAKKTAILQAFTLELEEYGSPVKIQFRYAGNRNIDLSREVIVVSGQSRFLEAFGMAVDGVHMVEKNWLVLSELAPGMCVVKVCMGLSVNVECNLPNRQQFVDRLNELLARQKQMSFESVLQGVEQSLLIS